MNDELPNRILSGTVQVKPNIRRFQGSSVEFDDGNIVEDVDLVVGLLALTLKSCVSVQVLHPLKCRTISESMKPSVPSYNQPVPIPIVLW